MKLRNNDLHKILDTARQLFKDKHYPEYDSELQHALCILIAFCKQHSLNLELEPERKSWETYEQD